MTLGYHLIRHPLPKLFLLFDHLLLQASSSARRLKPTKTTIKERELTQTGVLFSCQSYFHFILNIRNRINIQKVDRN